jgi:hypothetical protein
MKKTLKGMKNMYNDPTIYSWQHHYPYYANGQYVRQHVHPACPCRAYANQYYDPRFIYKNLYIPLKDYGPNPLALNINEASKQNNTYRTALWTGEHLQVTLMSIDVGDDIGLEVHLDVDHSCALKKDRESSGWGKTKIN